MKNKKNFKNLHRKKIENEIPDNEIQAKLICSKRTCTLIIDA